MKRVMCVVLGTVLLACSPSIMNKGNGSRIKTLRSKTESIEYKSHRVLLADLKRQAELNMWTTERFRQEALGLPEGGFVVFRVSRMSIGAADSEWFTGIVQLNGRDVVRTTWNSSVPSPDVNYSGWLNVMVLAIPELMPRPFDVYLVDNLQKNRSHWKITPQP